MLRTSLCILYTSFIFILLANEYGLFRPDEDPTKGRWLEQGRTLEYYHLKDGVSCLCVLVLVCVPALMHAWMCTFTIMYICCFF